MSKWTLFSNHGHVLLYLSQDPEVRLRDVAARVGITERAVQKIVRDLQDGGMLTVAKHGRRNRYSIHLREHLRHKLEAHCTVGQLVDLVGGGAPAAPETPTQEPASAAVPLPESAGEPARNPEPDPIPVPEPMTGSHPPVGDAARPARPRRSKRKPDKDAGEQGSLF